ncbi:MULTISPECIES: hypothetical protein [unclassified Modestobacter]|uniref:hypothetical protein n=1 Tax=unclassified Modestobacter TaxID=2643866 RepID=UPI0022AA3565|nr:MULTISPECIES: hypothetical protein [unclassified Modestobacter]MCZ2826538.1 hypothetical protein [Modestobacter sp. VKM Ac-2981]MCZ2852397.1 hypothetical protein [Modestobacter sp. VKM Ac-2982]
MALLDDVRALCDRLAPHGWADLLVAHGLDIGAADLAAELARPLPGVDREVPGFEDFAAEGRRGVEPRSPARSLLLHALASPNVTRRPDGRELTGFATPAELSVVEDHVFGVRPPSLAELLVAAGTGNLAIVVFATEYRPSAQTPHQRHADLVFARTGVSRVGTAPPRWDGRLRGFLPTVADDPHGVRVLPARYAPYLAVLVPGDQAGAVPMRFRPADGSGPGDAGRRFWVPLHKLFPGAECIRGRTLSVRLTVTHTNEKLRRIHLALGPDASWGRPDVDRPPFRFSDGIAELSEDPGLGPGTVVPVPHARLVEPAEYQGRPLTFRVPPNQPLSSSLNIPAEGLWRHGPEYVHVRSAVADDGTETDLNTRPDVAGVVAAGGYRARHHVDFTGDGWVAAVVPELAPELPRSRSAYSLVAAPDFFPSTDQRELTEWAATRVPSRLRTTIWRVPPDPLSDERFPANLTLSGSGFRPDDDTVTAIVCRPQSPPGERTRLETSHTERHSHLPDDAAGVFAPGWDVSVDGRVGGPVHLAAYGLGSPFPEDSKLCAALSAFWPAVAPDAARTFQPMPDWPTVAPLTDEEIGVVGDLPWDGVPGPRPARVDGADVVDYPSLDHADYVATSLRGAMTLALTGAVREDEYRSRVLAMARAYEALGVDTTQDFRTVVREKARWSVLSFRALDPADAEAVSAGTAAGVRLTGPLYRVVVFLRGAVRPHPTAVDRVHVEVRRRVDLLVDPVVVLTREEPGGWASSG